MCAFVELFSAVCPQSDLQTGFNQVFDNNPVIQLLNQSESAAIIRQVWTDENLRNFHDCRITIDSNLYSPYGKYGRGMFVSIRRINFRKQSNAKDAECLDYVRISFGQARLQKICGTFEANDELGRQAFFNDDGGDVKIHVFIDKTRPLTAGQRSLELEMVFTAYDSKFSNFIYTLPID